MDEYGALLQAGWLAGAAMGVPLLLVAAGSGFVFALVQSLIQVQDQALPQVIKILIVFAMLALFGTALSQPLVTFTASVFSAGHGR